MKLLITGNCGFIGQNFVRLFREKHDIIGIDNMSYASDNKAFNLCHSHICDISDIYKVEKIIKYNKPDAIINFAANSHVDNSIISPEPFMKDNFMGVFNLLEIARKYNISRFLQISTDECYGDLQINDPPFSNIYELKPSSPYSASKAAADMLVLAYHRTYGLNIVITRSCNNYGPYQYKEKFLPVVILNALNDKPIPVYGAGKNIREWIWVNDNCMGIEAALLNGKSGGIYHIGSGQEIENLEMVKKILSILNKPESLIKMVEDRKGHDFRYSMNSEKTYKELNWKPIMNIDNGLKQTIEWFSNNINYWK